MDYQVTPIVEFGCQLGEGPIWDHRCGRLMWIDITGGMLYSTDPATRVTDSFELGEHVGAVSLLESGDYFLALRDGFAKFVDGKIGQRWQVLQSEDIRMNDAGVDPRGRYVGGSMAYDAAKGAASLYSLDLSGEVTEILDGVTISNGLDWSDSGETMFYIDTRKHCVNTFDYDLATGMISNREVHAVIPVEEGSPDGLTLDAEGCLWVALYGGSKVIRLSREGRKIDEIPMPVSQVTACAFGGDDMSTLFITTAAQGLDEGAEPLAGTLFAVETSTRGRPSGFVGNIV